MTFIIIIYVIIGTFLYIFQRKLIYFPTGKISHNFEIIQLENEKIRDELHDYLSEKGIFSKVYFFSIVFFF